MEPIISSANLIAKRLSSEYTIPLPFFKSTSAAPKAPGPGSAHPPAPAPSPPWPCLVSGRPARTAPPPSRGGNGCSLWAAQTGLGSRAGGRGTRRALFLCRILPEGWPRTRGHRPGWRREFRRWRFSHLSDLTDSRMGIYSRNAPQVRCVCVYSVISCSLPLFAKLPVLKYWEYIWLLLSWSVLCRTKTG